MPLVSMRGDTQSMKRDKLTIYFSVTGMPPPVSAIPSVARPTSVQDPLVLIMAAIATFTLAMTVWVTLSLQSTISEENICAYHPTY